MDFDNQVAKFVADIGAAKTLKELGEIEEAVRGALPGHTIVECEALRVLFDAIRERAKTLLAAMVTP